jgi:hypothetical protein
MPAPTTEAGLTPCFSCLTPRPDDQLGECMTFRTRTCGLGNCKGTCLCFLMGERDDVDDE